MYDSSVGYNIIDVSNIINIHKYLIRKTRFKVMFRFIKKNVYQIIKF